MKIGWRPLKFETFSTTFAIATIKDRRRFTCHSTTNRESGDTTCF
jgi:hypothetical protein